jgi:hypothetical protein
MTENENTPDDIARAGEQLFQYAIDRGDMNTILDGLPLAAPEKRGNWEYEIQLLRIISVGWAIAFFLADDGQKLNSASNSGSRSEHFPPPFPPRHH